MKTNKNSLDYIFNHATEINHNWSNVKKVQFHYFNENGLYSQWRKMCDTISQYVDDGIIKSGWIIAYGSFNSYSYDNMRKLNSMKRITDRKYYIFESSMREDIEKGYTCLGEFLLGEID